MAKKEVTKDEKSPQPLGREFKIGQDIYVVYKDRFKKGQKTTVKLNGEVVFEDTSNRSNVSKWLKWKRSMLNK